MEEADLQLFAVYSIELTTAIGKSGGGKQKKELIEGQSLNRGLDLKFCPSIRNILKHAGATPSAIDGHHVRGQWMLEGDPAAFLLFFCRHRVNRTYPAVVPPTN
jgi:hypothetical protein